MSQTPCHKIDKCGPAESMSGLRFWRACVNHQTHA